MANCVIITVQEKNKNKKKTLGEGFETILKTLGEGATAKKKTLREGSKKLGVPPPLFFFWNSPYYFFVSSATADRRNMIGRGLHIVLLNNVITVASFNLHVQ